MTSLIVDFLCKGNYCLQEIDFDHYLTTADCGKLSDVVELPSQPLSRISSAEDSDVYYPWVVVVRRTYSKGDFKAPTSECAGTIITQK